MTDYCGKKRVYVNNARVETANVIVADVVHVINAVLLPKGF